MNKIIMGVCTVIEFGCIAGLAAIGLKRNKDAYNAEMKYIKASCELACEQLSGIRKDVEIRKLEKELEILKGKTEES